MLLRHHIFYHPVLLPRHSLSQRVLFHETPTWGSQFIDHYEILGLGIDASAEAIKKQFYQLSKTHHPDHNPDDPQASDRFVKISEAYAVLGNPQKRERYDRDVQRDRRGNPSHHAPRGSHSSSSTPFGSRPASGLSRRRTQFKGPPPSFYRSGGWGQHGAKRQSQANAAAAPTGNTGIGNSRGGGLGPGPGQARLEDDVPHFDREGHSRTQEQQDQRRRRRLEEETVGHRDGGSLLIKFTLITAVVSFAVSAPGWFENNMNKRRRRKEES